MGVWSHTHVRKGGFRTMSIARSARLLAVLGAVCRCPRNRQRRSGGGVVRYDPVARTVTASITANGQATLVGDGGAPNQLEVRPGSHGVRWSHDDEHGHDQRSPARPAASRRSSSTSASGIFAPGATSEFSISEIEFNLDMGDATDSDHRLRHRGRRRARGGSERAGAERRRRHRRRHHAGRVQPRSPPAGRERLLQRPRHLRRGPPLPRPDHGRLPAPGNDFVRGSTFDDNITGADGNDALEGNDGADVIDSGVGQRLDQRRSRERRASPAAPGTTPTSSPARATTSST